MTAAAGPPKLRGRWIALGAGMLAQACVSSLQQGLPAIGPLLRDSFSLTLAELGALLACAAWGVMLTTYLWGRLADIWGERIVVTTGLGGAALALVAVQATETALGLGLAIVAAGAMSGSAIAASGRAILGWFPRSERGFALGLRQMAVPLGAGFAALVLPAAALRYGIQGAFGALALLAATGAVVAIVALRPPPGAPAPAGPSPAAPAPVRDPIRDPVLWRLSTASGLMQWSHVAVNGFVVVILVEHQRLDYATAAVLFAVIQLLSGIARVAAGWASDRGGRRLTHLVGHAVALTVALLVAALLQRQVSGLSVAALVATAVMVASWHGLAFASVAELAGQGRAGSALGLHSTLMRALTIPTALAFGWVASRTSWSAALALLALFPVAGLALMSPLVAEEERRASQGAG